MKINAGKLIDRFVTPKGLFIRALTVRSIEEIRVLQEDAEEAESLRGGADIYFTRRGRGIYFVPAAKRFEKE